MQEQKSNIIVLKWNEIYKNVIYKQMWGIAAQGEQLSGALLNRKREVEHNIYINQIWNGYEKNFFILNK